MPFSTNRPVQMFCGGLCAGLLLIEAGETQTLFTFERVYYPYHEGANLPSFGDYDNDGWPDFIIINPLLVFHNEGDDRFSRQNALLPQEVREVISGGIRDRFRHSDQTV